MTVLCVPVRIDVTAMQATCISARRSACRCAGPVWHYLQGYGEYAARTTQSCEGRERLLAPARKEKKKEENPFV
jgi:hypothetical protein